MSVVSMIFNRGTLKLLLALSIPAAIGWAFYYASEQATVEVAKFKQEQEENPGADHVTVSNYELKEVDDSNQIRWQLVASKGIVDQTNQVVTLEDVRVKYFDGATQKMSMSSPSGEAHEQDHYVKLIGSAGKPVVAEGEKGARLEAKIVELTKKNQFQASGGVNIVLPEVAKVTGNSATGTIDASGVKDFKIVGNTHAEIVVK